MNPKDQAFKKAQDALEEAKNTSATMNETDTSTIASKISQDFTETVEPMLMEMKSQIETSGKEIIDALKNIQIPPPNVTMPDMPEIKMPTINVPQPKVTVNVPKADAPIVNVPAPIVNFPDSMALHGIDNRHPLPVILTDDKGNPYIAGSLGGGGGHGPVNIADILVQGATILDQTNRAMRVSVVSTSATGSTASALIDSSGVQYSGSNPVPVTLVSGGASTTATNIVDSSGVAYSGSNPLPTTATITLPFGPGDGATATRVIQAGDTVSSVIVNSILTSLATSLTDSSGVQYSGSNPVPVSGAVSQSGTWNIGTVTTLTGITNSVQTALVDSSGVQYSGSNPLPITVISGGNTSMISVGPTVTGVADDGSAPVKVGRIARTTNPTAVTDGQTVSSSADKLGRTLTRPIQVRDLISTAYITLSTGTEATLLAGVAGAFLDLIYIEGANTSTAAVQIDIRATTAGNIIKTLFIPAQSTAGVNLSVPWPQDNQGNNWTVDMGDFTNSNVLLSALFTKEV